MARRRRTAAAPDYVTYMVQPTELLDEETGEREPDGDPRAIRCIKGDAGDQTIRKQIASGLLIKHDLPAGFGEKPKATRKSTAKSEG